MTETRKEPKDLLIGDIFVYSDYGRQYHFQVKRLHLRVDDSYTRLRAVLLWADGDGKYYEYGPGYVEEFSFRNDRFGTLRVLKTTRNGCCPDCLGTLDWITLALKCNNCGKIVI